MGGVGGYAGAGGVWVGGRFFGFKLRNPSYCKTIQGHSLLR